MDKIKVRYGTKEYWFSLDENYELSLKCLQSYCSLARGLSCQVDDVKTMVTIKDGQLIIKPNYTNFEVFTETDSTDEIAMERTPISSPAVLIDVSNTKKKERVNFYRHVIEGRATASSTEKPPIQYCTVQKKPKISDLRKITPLPKPKLVKIGWKHRFSESGRYLQQKVPIGGTQELELNLMTEYSVQDIIEISKKKFASNTAMQLLPKSNIKLGFFNHTEIESFSLPDGKHCGLWDYYRHQSWNMSRMHLYLLSTLKNEFSNDAEIKKLHLNDEVDESKDLIDNSEEKNEVININEEIANVDDGKKDLNVQELSNTVPVQSITKENTEEDVIHQRIETLKENIVNNKEEKGEEEQCIGILQENINDGKDLNVEVEDSERTEMVAPESYAEVPASNYEIKAISNNFNQIDVLYRYVTISKYSGEYSIGERDKIAMYWTIVDEAAGEFPIPEQEEFDPVDHGYEICRIVVNNHILLKVEVDGDMQRYIFPSSNCEEHAIAHDIDEVIGFSVENFGLGIIPKCIETCNPTVTWYCNDVLYKQGKMSFWLHNVPITSNEDTWHCEVSCKSKGTLISKKIKLSNKQPKCLNLNVTSVPEIKRKDFTLTDEILGSGTQGKVCKGKYGDFDVAVKTIKIYSRNTKHLEREIAVLQSIRHENFIFLMAVCREIKRVHLIMECFLSKSLSDLIYDDEAKELYQLDINKKRAIFQQLCNAIAYLHSQSNPIIHRAIKPDNVLVNKDNLVKICDFGLSKFSITITALTTTIGSSPVGTVMYLAPEILINKQTATLSSDIWSLGCTIVEMYKEDPVWDVASHNELEKKMHNKEIPVILEVPQEYKSIIAKCLDYDEGNRPNIIELVNTVTKED